jgi:hypothetical protein
MITYGRRVHQTSVTKAKPLLPSSRHTVLYSSCRTMRSIIHSVGYTSASLQCVTEYKISCAGGLSPPLMNRKRFGEYYSCLLAIT